MFIGRIIAAGLLVCFLIGGGWAKTEIITGTDGYLISKGNDFRIVFDEAVVPMAEVGAPMKEGFLLSDPDLDIDTRWDSPNVLVVTPKEDVPYRSRQTWKITDGAAYASGKLIPADAGETCGRNALSFDFDIYGPDRGNMSAMPQIAAMDERGVPLSGEIIDEVVFIPSEDSDVAKYGSVKGRMEHLSINAAADIREWSISRRIANLKEQTPREEWDKPIPSLVSLSPGRPLKPGVRYKLLIKDGQKTYEKMLGVVPEFDASLDYDPSDQDQDGSRMMALRFSPALRVDDLTEFFRSRVAIKADGESAVNADAGAVKKVSNKSGELVFEIPEDALKTAAKKHAVSRIPITIRGDAVFECDMEIQDPVAVDGQDSGGKPMKVMKSIKLKSPELYLDFENNGLISKGGRMLGFRITNLSGLRFSTKKISDDLSYAAFNAYDAYYKGEREGRKVTRKGNVMKFVPMDILDPVSGIIETFVDCKGKTRLEVPFDKACGRNCSPGMYLIEVEGEISPQVVEGYNRFGITDYEGNTRSYDGKTASLAAQALVQLTDIGILWKTTKKEAFIYGYSLATGKPLEEGSVSFVDGQGKVLQQAELKDGTALVLLPPKTEFLCVSSGDDRHITRLKSYGLGIDLYSYDVDTPDYMFEATGTNLADFEMRRVFLFTDRSLYKPGEEFHLKGVSRIIKGNEVLPDKLEKVFLTLKNPRGDTLAEREIPVSAFGTFDFSYRLPEGDVGSYRVDISTQKEADKSNDGEDEDYGSSYYKRRLARYGKEFYELIQVAEFKRNAFEVSSSLKEPSVGDAAVSVTTKAVNYMGVPVADATVNWVMTATPVNFYPKNYSDYEFGDHREYDRGYWQAYYGYGSGAYYNSNAVTVKFKDELDDEGKGATGLKLPVLKEPRSLAIDVASAVTDGNEQTITSRNSVTLHPSNVYAGVRRVSSIRSSEEGIKLDLIALGLDGKPYAKPVDVEITAVCKAFRPVRYMGEGTTTVKNEESSETVFSGTVTISPEDSRQSAGTGRQVEIPAGKPGVYTVTIKGKDEAGHGFMTATRVWVYGDGYSPWQYMDGMKINLVPDKPLYKPGDTARILLQTPIEGEVMVTVERERIIRHYSRNLTLKNSVVEIPVEDSDAPNVYVSVFLVKGAELSGRRAQNPQLKLGYCSLGVQPVSSVLDVKINAPERSVLPGSSTKITGRVLDAGGKPAADSEVTLFVEDEGTLAVIGYDTPDPVSFFYDPRPLDVKTCTILNRILNEDMSLRSFDNKGTFIGGGGIEFGAADYLEEARLRTDFNPCAYWLASARTDKDGNFSAEYTNPDTLTRYRVIAVAVDRKDRFGKGESNYVVNKPVMLEPSVPFFACQGDELVLPVSISKTDARRGKWKVTLQSNSVAAVDEDSQLVTVPDSGTMTARFRVKMVATGEARLTWDIKPVDDQGNVLTDDAHARLVDRIELRFDVNFPAPILREDHMLSLDPGTVPEVALNDLLGPELKTGKTTMELTLSSSPMIFATGSLEFLLGYPHGCLEQKSSTTIPWLYADILARYIPRFPSFNEEKRKDMIQAGVNGLLKHQASNGALVYWNGDRDGKNSEFSPYAALVLLTAKEMGASVPAGALDRLWANWKSLAASPSKSPFNFYMACWVRARGGAMDMAELNKILDEAKDLTKIDGMFLSLAVLELNPPHAKQLVADILGKSEKNLDRSWRNVHADAVELILHTKLAPASPGTGALFARFVQRKQGSGGYYYTWLSGWDVYAMGYYLSRHNTGREDSLVELVSEGKKENMELPKDGSPLIRELTPESKAVLYDRKGTAYARLFVSGKPARLESEKVANKGFVITRTYETMGDDGKWKPASEFRVGDVVKVSIEAGTTGTGAREYVVIEDYLPSAFEAVNPELVSQMGDSLPEGYSWNSWVSNREFMKDRVCFYITSWMPVDRFRATYLARVTKAGTVTAPPAKAELMYEPQVYGLTPNLKLKVLPREKDE